MNALASAVAAAHEAGAVLLEHLHRPLGIQEKGRRADLVTLADRASERVIVERLRRDYPSAAILGEEGGVYRGDERERWIVDPLDGTTNYAHGYPLFCISIGYERDGEIRAGVVYAPLMNELFTAERGAGAFRNGEPMHVSEIASLAHAMVVTGFKPYDYETNAPYFAEASHRAQAVRRDGAAALDLAYTAMGRFDGFWEFDLAPWDMAAGVLLVREAGGTVSATDAPEFDLAGRSVLATNGRIHEELLAIF
ncbi:MAG TPA: inositol monophosphatase family protein [Candidatus Baltobacteraceae bacterium]|nr:inositol monophosphatase family protein [Candidatus Baltobacteraceae bacterium]